MALEEKLEFGRHLTGAVRRILLIQTTRSVSSVIFERAVIHSATSESVAPVATIYPSGSPRTLREVRLE